jgi:AraC-like DNA-binding protein
LCTETIIADLPDPRESVPLKPVDPAGWLRALRDDRTEIASGYMGRQAIRTGMVTQRRTAESRYGIHYLFYSPDAALRVQVPDRHFPIAPGTLAWFPPGRPYALYMDPGRRTGRLLRFRFTARSGGRTLSPWREEQLFPAASWYPSFLDQVEREMVAPDPHSPEQWRSLLIQLSIRLFRERRQSAPGAAPLCPLQVHAVYKYFLEHVAERPTSAALAAVAGLSPAYFARMFTRTMGVSPRRWMTEQRIAHSRQLLLDTSLNISEIAYRLGYQEPRLYIRQFRAATGTSPRAYRTAQAR